MQLSFSIILVIITALVSITAFSRPQMMDDLLFYGPAVSQRKQYYRLVTHGFIHADYAHLVFNMLALWSFGEGLETVMSIDCVFGGFGRIVFLVLYFTGLVVASLPDAVKHKDSYHFRSLGASGAVSAVVFSMILFFPQTPINFFFIPIDIPGWLFGLAYLGISAYLDRRGGGRVNHSAHFWGAAYGIAFTAAACYAFADSFDLVENFTTQLKSSSKTLTLLCQ